MITVCRKSYTFSAAHWIPTLPDGHKCKKMHGHTYTVVVEVGRYNEDSGMCMEFGLLDDVVNPIIAQLDHNTLNSADHALDVPTVEVLSRYVLGRITGRAPVMSVTVREGNGGEATTRNERVE